jgi:glycosyltransferase involved in cell wall biosynthesis
MRPKISIITPSFRQLDWLRLCAASVADQKEVEVEHIVQDAGTGAELEAWAAAQAGLKLHVENDQGMYDAVNRGLRRASGEILAYLNCDEQYLPGTLAAVVDFFAAHPEVDVVFGNVVVVDGAGHYFCSREVLPPRLYHSWVCTLGVFTAATFFRRRVLEKSGLYFSDDWRDLGDAVWIMELLRRKVPMALLGQFATAFTDTGENMNIKPNAIREKVRLRESAPAWAQRLAPVWVAQHRLRRLLKGRYWPQKLSYEIFTRENPAERSTFVVNEPTFVWPGRF